MLLARIESRAMLFQSMITSGFRSYPRERVRSEMLFQLSRAFSRRRIRERTHNMVQKFSFHMLRCSRSANNYGRRALLLWLPVYR